MCNSMACSFMAVTAAAEILDLVYGVKHLRAGIEALVKPSYCRCWCQRTAASCTLVARCERTAACKLTECAQSWAAMVMHVHLQLGQSETCCNSKCAVS